MSFPAKIHFLFEMSSCTVKKPTWGSELFPKDLGERWSSRGKSRPTHQQNSLLQSVGLSIILFLWLYSEVSKRNKGGNHRLSISKCERHFGLCMWCVYGVCSFSQLTRTPHWSALNALDSPQTSKSIYGQFASMETTEWQEGESLLRVHPHPVIGFFQAYRKPVGTLKPI